MTATGAGEVVPAKTAGGGRVGLRGVGVLLAALLGLLLSYLLYRQLRENENQRIDIQLSLDAEQRIRGVERELDSHLEILRAVRAFYEGSKEVDRDEFRAFTASALRRNRSIEAIQWAPNVAAVERAAHERQMQAAGLPDYAIREPEPDRPAAAVRPLHAPVAFVEPRAGRDDLFGVDLAALPGVRETMIRARDSGQIAACPRMSIPRSGRPTPETMLAVIAIYTDTELYTPEERRRRLQGYAVALIRLAPVIEDALDRIKGLDMGLRVFDREDQLLHDHRIADPVADRRFRKGGVIRPADADLVVECAPPQEYVRLRRTAAPTVMGLALLVVVGVGVAYLYLLTRHTDRIERLVEVRTAMIRDVSRLQQAILDGAPYTIVSTDLVGRIRTFNRAAERMLGYEAEELVDRETPEVFHRADEMQAYAAELAKRGIEVTNPMQALLAVAAAGEIDVNEWTFVRRDGTEFPVSLSVTALRSESGEVTGYLGMAEDITERKQAEMALVAAKTAAEEANRTKSRFLANMSHELRTPLNAIIGYAEMLEEDAVAAGKHDVAGDLRRIATAAYHLLQLINDVLDLSKIEAGRIDIHDEPVTLDRLIGEVTGTVSRMAADRGNTLEATCDPAIGVMVTDGTRVRQILFNLLSNAAKFTTSGSIRVRAVLEPDPPAQVVISVADTGIGMHAAQLERIFEPFAQADGSTTRKYGGTGLGLAICREFCRLMEGSISVESEPNVGSTFTVRLPYHPGPEAAS